MIPLPTCGPQSQHCPPDDSALLSNLPKSPPNTLLPIQPCLLNLGPAGKPAPPLLVHPPVGQVGDEADEPEDGVGKDDPDGAPHAHNVVVALWVLIDVHFAKDAKEDDPEDEEHEVPDPDGGEAEDVGDAVEEGCQGGEAAYYFCVDLVCNVRL